MVGGRIQAVAGGNFQDGILSTAVTAIFNILRKTLSTKITMLKGGMYAYR